MRTFFILCWLGCSAIAFISFVFSKTAIHEIGASIFGLAGVLFLVGYGLLDKLEDIHKELQRRPSRPE